MTLFFFYSSPYFGTTFFFSPVFGNAIATIVTIFFPYFGNAIATISLSQFFSPISAMPLPQLLYHNFFPLFRQWHCHNQFVTNFFFPISAMPLPQLVCHKFFFPLFRQWHCHNQFVTIFFLISAMPLPQFVCHKFFSLFSHNFFFPLFWQCHCQNQFVTIFFFPYFGNAIAKISLSQKIFSPISAMALPQLICHNFFFPISAMPLPQLVCQNFFFPILAMALPQLISLWALHAHFTPEQQELGREISIFTLLKSNIFSLPLFLLLSHTFC